MAALARFHRDMSWSGTIEAGGMGPGTPAMTARGSGTHTVIQDGLWIVGDYRQDQFLTDGVRPRLAATLGRRLGSGAGEYQGAACRQLRSEPE